jgi:hypothetical protein
MRGWFSLKTGLAYSVDIYRLKWNEVAEREETISRGVLPLP